MAAWKFSIGTGSGPLSVEMAINRSLSSCLVDRLHIQGLPRPFTE